MAKQIRTFSEKAMEDIKDLVNKSKGPPPHSRSRHNEEDDHLPPEVYIARTPPEGIAALVGLFNSTGTGSGWAGTGTGTGTGTWATEDDQPGFAECQIHRIVRVYNAPVLQPVRGLTRRIYNLSSTPIPGDEWFVVARDKWGDWVALQGGSGGISNLAAGGRLSGAGLNEVSSLLFYTPHIHDHLAIWDETSARYVERSIRAVPYRDLADLVLPETVDDFNFDVYAYWDGSSVRMELREWEVGQVEAYAIKHTISTPATEFYGTYIKGDNSVEDPTRRYLGSGRYQVELGWLADRYLTKAFLWNVENRVPVTFKIRQGSSSDYTYSDPAFRAWGDSGGTFNVGKFEWIQAFLPYTDMHQPFLISVVHAARSTSARQVRLSLGCNSINPIDPDNSGLGRFTIATLPGSSIIVPLNYSATLPGRYAGADDIEPGYNFIVPLEYAENTTVTWEASYSSMTVLGWF